MASGTEHSPLKASLSSSVLKWSLACIFSASSILLAAYLMNQLITPDAIEKQIYKFLSVDFVRIEPSRTTATEMEDEYDAPEEIPPETPLPQELKPRLSTTELPKLSIESQDLDTIALPLSFNAPAFDTNAIAPVADTIKPAFDEQLFPLLTPAPLYPRRAKRAGIEGWVNISFIIGVNGNVKDVEVLSAEPEGIFERNAIQSVKKWKFKPQLLAGKPTARKVVQTINFSLEN